MKLKSNNVLEHVIRDISSALERSLFAEKIGARPGLLQSLDARVKVVCTLALLIAVSLSHSLAVIGAVYIAVLGLACRSRIPAFDFIRRVWLFLPLFTGVLIVPALFLTPGPTLISAASRPGHHTDGLDCRLVLAFESKRICILNSSLNPDHSLEYVVLSALHILRVPDVFILTLGMTYRYIYLLLHIANDMFLSRKSRVVGRLSGVGSATHHGRSCDNPVEPVAPSEQRGLPGHEVARVQRPSGHAKAI